MSGLFGSRDRTATESQKYSKTATTTGERTPRQTSLFNEIIAQLNETINQGPNVRPEDLAAMRGQVKGTYGQIAPRVGAALKSRGMSATGGKPSSSPSPGGNFRGIDIAQGNQMAAGKSNLADLARQRYMQSIGMAFPLTKPTTTVSTSTGTKTGSETQPGPSLFDQMLGYASQIAGIAAGFGAFGSPGMTGRPDQVPWGAGPGFGAMYGGI